MNLYFLLQNLRSLKKRALNDFKWVLFQSTFYYFI